MDRFVEHLRRALEDLDDAGLALMLVRPTLVADAVRDGLARAKGVLRDELGAYLAAWEAIGRAGGTDVERRFLLKLAGLLPSATRLPESAERLAAGLSRPGPLDGALLDAVAGISGAYAGAYYVAPPRELLVLVQAHLDRIYRLTGASGLPTHRRRVRALLSDGAAFAGWLSLDAGRPCDARSYLTLARDAAREAGDPTLHALAVASHALLLTNVAGAEPSEALWMLRQAGAQLSDDAPWEARAWLAVHTAKEYAAAGDRDGYLLHAQAAATTWDALGGGESREGFFSPGGWFSDVDDEWFQDCTLRSLAHLTDPAAEPALRAALDQPGHPRREATLLETLAVCLARRAEPEQAAAAALGSLDAAHGLPLWVDRVREVRADLEPWADLPAVRELDDALVGA